MPSQTPRPDPTADQNLSSATYFPRRTPPTSNPPILTLLILCSAKALRSNAASMTSLFYGLLRPVLGVSGRPADYRHTGTPVKQSRGPVGPDPAARTFPLVVSPRAAIMLSSRG